MSHFIVMVIGEDPEYELAPFHEYECTGVDDEFVIDVDITDEAQETFKDETTLVVTLVDGKKVRAFDDEGTWSNDVEHLLVEKDFGRRDLPESVETEWLPATEWEDFTTWAKHYYGAKVRDGRLYRHTNPNAKWDWWTTGGRWGGFLKLKPGRIGRDFRVERPSYKEKNKPSVPGGKCDQARAGGIDWEAMKAEARKKAEEIYDLADPHEPWETWETLRERHTNDVDLARREYREQAGLVTVQERLKDAVGFSFNYDDLLKGREAYCETEANRGVTTFAFVQNREWFEKGEMGWFAMVDNEKDQDDWNAIMWQKIQALPADALVTIVDCHI